MPVEHEIRFKSSAWKALKKLQRTQRGRIKEAVWGLSENPRPFGCRKLSGTEPFFRIRVGDYRVVYEVQDDVHVVLVIKIGHRRDVYEAR